MDTFLRFGRDPKTKGRDAKTDNDGNEISGWANNNGAQNIVEVQDRLLHLKSPPEVGPEIGLYIGPEVKLEID